MYRIYYAGRKDMPETNEANTRRTEHGHKMCDLRMGIDFFKEHCGWSFPTETDIATREVNLVDFGYTHVGTTTLTDLERIFVVFQGEYMDVELVRDMLDAGATHTSMSVGDVLVEVGTGRVLFCDRFGFVEV